MYWQPEFFYLKTSVFRDVKWCFNASRGLKGLNYITKSFKGKLHLYANETGILDIIPYLVVDI